MAHEDSTTEKVYVLVRADLPPGLQMAQAIHAAVALTMEHPERVAVTPNVVVLNVPDEDALLDFADAFVGAVAPQYRIDAPWALFHEPDLEDHPDGWHTAIACISDGRAFSALPLAGREVAMT